MNRPKEARSISEAILDLIAPVDRSEERAELSSSIVKLLEKNEQKLYQAHKIASRQFISFI